MFKTTILTLLVGVVTATAIVPSNALTIAQPNYPKKPVASSTEEECAYQLNYMPRVTRAHIEAIQDRHVYLIPVCEDGLLGRDDYGWLFTNGNVGTLRQPIAGNATLMSALVAEGYDHQDVVSLRFGGDGSIALYVHQRDLR